MSKRDFDRYYNDVQAQYNEMMAQLKNLTDVVNENMVSEDVIKNMTKLLEPIKQNYMTLSYVAFLLNKPVKKGKESRYKKQNRKILDACGNRRDVDVLDENRNCLESLKEEIDKI